MLTRVVAKQAKPTEVKNKFFNGKKSSKEYSVVFLVEGEKFNLGEKKLGDKVQAKSSNLPCRFSSNSVGTLLEFAAFRSGFDAKYSRASVFWFFSVHSHGFYGVPNTFCQEKHQHFHADRQLVTKKEISIKINLEDVNPKRPWPSGLTSGFIRRRPGFGSQRGLEIFLFLFLFFFCVCFLNNDLNESIFTN